MDLAPDFDEFIGSLIAPGAEFLIVADIDAITPGEE
jgi:hypothetical protein